MKHILLKSLCAFAFVAGGMGSCPEAEAMKKSSSSQNIYKPTIPVVHPKSTAKTTNDLPQPKSKFEMELAKHHAVGTMEFAYPAKYGEQAETFYVVYIHSLAVFRLCTRIFLKLRGRDLQQLDKDVQKKGSKRLKDDSGPNVQL